MTGRPRMLTRVGPVASGWQRLAPFGLLALAELAVLLWSHRDAYYTSIALQWAAFALLAQAFNVIAGYAGRLAFGNTIFFGATAYIVAAGAAHHWYPPLVGLTLALPACMVLAYLLGMGLWRVGGLLFALATFAISEMLRQLATIFPALGGPAGIQEPLTSTTSIVNLSLSSQYSFVLLGCLLVFTAAVASHLLRQSGLGKQMMAARDDRIAAATSGVNAAQVSATAWAISAAITAIAATFYVQYNLFVDPNSAFGLPTITLIVVPAILGGLGTVWGPVVGSVVIPVASLLNRLSGDHGITGINQLLYGLVLIVVLRLYPQGLTSAFNRLQGRLHQRLAHSPSGPPPATPTPAHIGQPSPSTLALLSATARDGGHAPGHAKSQRPPIQPANAETGSTGTVILLDVVDVTKVFGGIRALDRVTFQVAAGGIVGLLGPNGAGKSTLYNCITGVEAVSSGRILFRDRSLTGLAPHQRARLGLARTYQTVRLFPRLSARDNATIPALATLPLPAALARADAVLTLTGLAPLAERPAAELSLVDQRRLELARAIAAGAELVMLDEVLTGLSEQESNELRELIRALNREQMTTFILVEHVMGHILPLIDRVIVLDRGTVLADGDPRRVLEQPEVIEAYFGGRATQGVTQWQAE